MVLSPLAQLPAGVLDSTVSVIGTVKKVTRHGFWIFRRHRVEIEIPQQEATKILAAAEKAEVAHDTDRARARLLFSNLELLLSGGDVPETDARIEMKLGFRGVLTQMLARERERVCISISPA